MPSQGERTSPLIDHVAWGELTVHGLGNAKDFKCRPGGGRPWDWRETGTRHVPGIQPDDIEELLRHGAGTIILSRGMCCALRTQQATLDYLQALGLDYYLAETTEAVARYNELARGAYPVAGLFHSTC